MSQPFAVIAGTANPELAADVAKLVGVRLGECTVGRFPDGEVSVSLEMSVRGLEVYLVQPLTPPVNDNLVELLALADACRRAAAGRVVAVVPYLGYARADKRRGRREPIAARMIADMMQAVGISQVVLIDPHTPQIEGFFHIPVETLTAVPVLCEALRGHLSSDVTVVSPDAGRTWMATRYAHVLGAPLVVLHKQRLSGSKTRTTHVVGNVAARSCLIIDDMISTGGTLAESVKALLEAGARPEIRIAATHGVLLPEGRANLHPSAVQSVFVTDTVRASAASWPNFHRVTVAPLLASAIQQLVVGGSIHDLPGSEV